MLDNLHSHDERSCGADGPLQFIGGYLSTVAVDRKFRRQQATMWYNCVHMVTLSPIAIILKRTCRETMDQSLQYNSNNNRFVNDGTAGSISTCYKPLCLYHPCPRHNCTLHSTTEDTAIIRNRRFFITMLHGLGEESVNHSREVEASRPRSKCTRRESRYPSCAASEYRVLLSRCRSD